MFKVRRGDSLSKYLLAYSTAVITVLGALLVRWLLSPYLGDSAPLILFTMSVATTALFSGFGPGILATLLSLLIGSYFFIQPYGDFFPTNKADAVRLVMFAVTGLVISWISHTRITYYRAAQEAAEARLEQEKLAQRQAAELAAVYDTAPIGLVSWDKDLRYVRVNKTLAEINGLPIEAHLGRTPPEIIPELNGKVENILRDVLRTGEPFLNVEMMGETKAQPGVERNWLVSYYPLKNEKGEIIGVNGIVLETTELRKAEEETRIFKLVADNSRDMVFLGDENARWVYVNSAACEQLGYTREELLSLSVTDIDAELNSEQMFDLAAKISEGNANLFETVHRRKDGTTFPVEVLSVEITADDGKIYYCSSARDISERKELLEKERRARANAENASRLKDEFLATVSHELRSPLNAILGWAKMLNNSTKMSDEQRKKALETIERNAKAQARLIEDLLDVSRIISGKLRLDVKPLNLAEIVGNVVENLRPAAEAKNISIKVNNNFREALVLADGERIQQVVFNLLSNAVKFTQESGRIDVGINRVNSHYEIKVKDNGRGIGTEFLPFVFDRFRQAERLTVGARAGLGLGLAISKSLVEAHGGEIFVESEGEDKGATFTVNIPIAVQQPAVLESAGLPLVSPIGSPRLGDLRILMVDDDPDACDVVRAVLEEHGATVFTATSAGRAFELFRREKPDVIISDIIMPEENGYQFIKRIRSLERSDGGREVPAVALTAKARVEDRLEALTAGFQMHVPKPIEPAELEVVIASLTARNQQH